MSIPARYPHVEAWLKATAARFDRQSRVLELGCGAGQYAQLFDEMSYVGLDVPETWYDLLRRPDVHGTADKMPFASEAFDLIFSVAAFDYFPRPEVVLSETRRCMSSRGQAFIFTYDEPTLQSIDRNCKAEGTKRSHNGHHVFTESSLTSMAMKAGLRLQRLAREPEEPVHRALWRKFRPGMHRVYRLEAIR